MAITTTPYGRFLKDLGSGVHKLATDVHKVCLLTNVYNPNFASDATYGDLSGTEVQGNGYDAGGITLVNQALTYKGASQAAVLTCDPVSWSGLTTTVRYAAIYRPDANSDQLLLGLINFGADRTYNAETFQLSFTNGVIALSV